MLRNLLILTPLLALPLQAAEPDALACPPVVDWDDPSIVYGPVDPAAPAEVQADQAQLAGAAGTTLRGDVTVDQPGRRIEAPVLSYDEAAGIATAPEGLTLRQDGIRLRAAEGVYHADDGSGSFREAEFHVPDRRMRGTADSVQLDGQDRSDLSEVVITSCREGEETWRLVAPTMELDHEEAIGVARNVRVELGPVPIFYTPYLSFPLDGQRKSGFLAPEFGGSSRRGTEIQVPVYWNIAPNMDALFTPYNMTARGLMLDSNFRYLGARSAGAFDVAYLPDDDQTGDDRARYRWRHRQDLGAGWGMDLQYLRVSDDDYYRDLGDSLDGVTPLHLRSYARIERSWTHWDLQALVQGWQTLDPTIAPGNLPYRTLPQLYATGDVPLGQGDFRFLFAAELTEFDREAGPIGTRLDLTPGLAWRWERPGMYLEAIGDLRHTSYQLDDLGAPADRSPSRTLPRASLDGGLVFERETGGGMLQTLEPRLMLLSIPFEDQSDHPDFDTAGFTLSSYSLYARDRFVGRDLVGDTDQATVGLTHRGYAPDGRQLYHLTLGQILYAGDRLVTTSGVPETESSSNLIAEASYEPLPGFSFTSSLEWDDRARDIARGSIGMRYRDQDRVLNISHRVAGATTEQSDLSFSWPVTRRLNAIGRWNYDQRNTRTLELFMGLEYESCCWALRLVSRQYLIPGTTTLDDTIFLQFVLKGLTGLGRSPDELLARGILGYSSGY